MDSTYLRRIQSRHGPHRLALSSETLNFLRHPAYRVRPRRVCRAICHLLVIRNGEPGSEPQPYLATDLKDWAEGGSFSILARGRFYLAG
jgi:hypothetical protein